PADECDRSFAQLQLARYTRALDVLRERGCEPAIRHVANSAATLTLPEARLDLVRIGITLSGHYPAPALPRSAALRPAVAFKARLARVYDLPAGTSVGYNRTFVAERSLRVGLVPVGYADGLPRAHSNRGAALIRGIRAPL